ncbi:MAG: site-specific DNA-methyltransferase, partial [Microcystis panniformis]
MVNQLYYGDNLEVLRRYIKDESVDLCYIDPPFNSKRNYNQIYNNIGAEDKAQAQAFIDTWEWDDHAIHGINEILINYHGLFTQQCIALITGLSNVLGKGSLLAYLVSMTLRITEIHRVLKPTGSFYLHCDPTASHYLKLILDAIFCSQGGEFINEIIWKRSTAKGDGKQGAKHFGRITDTILLYAKNASNYMFYPQYEPYTEEAVKRDYKYVEESTNRIYRLAPVDGPGGAAKGNPYYEFLGVKGYWRFTQEKMQKLYEEGRIIKSKTGKTLSQKIYLSEAKGRQIDNFWHDINKIAPTSKERLGYPTQKPEALLERIIKASSNGNDVILDAYCGCGTTVAVCQKLDRQWIGIDITYQSISLILKRLEDSFPGVLKTIKLHGIPKDIESARALAN